MRDVDKNTIGRPDDRKATKGSLGGHHQSFIFFLGNALGGVGGIVQYAEIDDLDVSAIGADGIGCLRECAIR